jgi:hypothetical protein
LYGILDGFKHCCFEELHLAFHVEGLYEPLNLAKEIFLILRLRLVILRDKVYKGYPVAFNQGQQ